MTRKLFILALLAMATTATVHAGGLMTNTNYHIAFDRMFARGASTEIDAAYSNPAGLAWGHEGFQFSLNFQKPWQYRNIEAVTTAGSQKFEGKASAPIVPALFASYKKGNWAFSTMIGIVGSGGFVEYKEGVPMFNMLVQGMLGQMNIAPNSYKIDSEMKGKQYIYGGQVNITRKINDNFSASIGLRANYYDGYYRGHVLANEHAQLGDLTTLALDVDQRGWGFAPIVSFDYHNGPLTIGARYEFRTKIETENKTNTLNAGLGTNLQAMLMQSNPAALQQIATTLGTYTAEYQDGVKTRYDMPSLFVAAVGYEFSPKLRGAVEYHFFDDKHAKMAGNRQKELEHGTHEILAGVEYDINDKFTISCGGQRTDYGLSDNYQKDTSFACDSYSVGCGGAWNINDKMRLNVSYFCTLYSDYNKPASYGSEVYSRTNHVIGVGLDYRF
ncbi:OmpP1/FadL family transporter [Prevotella sp. P6B1]|uniref:OmpP1/FadL family transporter n=1 Tax=Prevotella sp. P6B1 TaxID=1410613 RepID=UPI000A7BCD10|nr:outer membrane beta-barrel protein [Prevotella sp. P6B1]